MGQGLGILPFDWIRKAVGEDATFLREVGISIKFTWGILLFTFPSSAFPNTSHHSVPVGTCLPICFFYHQIGIFPCHHFRRGCCTACTFPGRTVLQVLLPLAFHPMLYTCHHPTPAGGTHLLFLITFCQTGCAIFPPLEPRTYSFSGRYSAISVLGRTVGGGWWAFVWAFISVYSTTHHAFLFHHSLHALSSTMPAGGAGSPTSPFSTIYIPPPATAHQVNSAIFSFIHLGAGEVEWHGHRACTALEPQHHTACTCFSAAPAFIGGHFGSGGLTCHLLP